MRTLIALLGLCLSLPASAGTLHIQKTGIVQAWVWVDAAPQGKIKKKKPVALNVPDGPHEVWVTVEPSGTVTTCHGLVTVKGDVTVSTNGIQCQGLLDGYPQAHSFFRGASITFRLDAQVDAWMSVDGTAPLALPEMPFLLNLAPGTHNVVLYTDNLKTSVFDQGSVTLKPGQNLPLTCTTSGCVGWNKPPVVIEQLPPSLGFHVDVGVAAGPSNGSMHMGAASASSASDAGNAGIHVDMSTTGDGSNAGIHMDMSATGGPDGGAMNADMGAMGAQAASGTQMSCCVNDQFYSCPSTAAVDKCSGSYMRCVASCDASDASCPDQCLADHPLDPSDCTPATGSCSN